MSDQHAVCSMTGFAAVQGTLDHERTFALTVKSVNHRHLDLQIKLPSGLDALEPALRAALKSVMRRGHVEVTLSVNKPAMPLQAGPPPQPLLEIDESALASYAAAFGRAAGKLGLNTQPDLNELLRLPGVLVPAAVPPAPAVDGAATGVDGPVLKAFHHALEEFHLARRTEGKALTDELHAAMARLSSLTAEAAHLRQGTAAREFERLRARMSELLASVGAEGPIDETRLITEAGILAARGDVEEELVRLQTHIARFNELLTAGGEVGRALDFLLQELNREANTLLSKTGGSNAGLRLTEIGLAIKVELERAREQVQNLE